MAKKKLVSLVQVKKKSQKVENLVENYNNKICISFTLNFLDTPTLILTYHFSNFLAIIFI